MRWRQAVNDIQQRGSGGMGWLHTIGRVRPKGRAEAGGDRTGVQGDTDRVGVRAGKFQRRALDDHIQRCLGGPIAVPAPQSIVADAADPRRQGGDGAAALTGQKRGHVF